MNDRFLILEGGSGKLKAAHDLPEPHAQDCIIVAKLTGGHGNMNLIVEYRSEGYVFREKRAAK